MNSVVSASLGRRPARPFQPKRPVATELHERTAPRLHQCALQTSGPASHGKAGGRLIRRTAVVRTRMPGGVEGRRLEMPPYPD